MGFARWKTVAPYGKVKLPLYRPVEALRDARG
jgi:hypothetical protein